MFGLCCAGSGFCDELITRSEESLPSVCVCVRARACVNVCDLGSSKLRRLRSKLGCCTTERKKLHYATERKPNIPSVLRVRNCHQNLAGGLKFIHLSQDHSLTSFSLNKRDKYPVITTYSLKSMLFWQYIFGIV